MLRTKLDSFVREQFGMELQDFFKQKVEKEALYDYEIAEILHVSASTVRKLRNHFGIKKAEAFSRRFENIYGKGAVSLFKKIIEKPDSTLSDVGGTFKFTREYARQVYKKIYGCAYTEAHHRKLQERKRKKIEDKKKNSKYIKNLMKVTEKMKSMGLDSDITNRKRSFMTLNNGFKLAVRATATPVIIGKKQYFRINNAKCPNRDLDFFICLCRNKKEDIHFIIPSSEMPQSVVTLLPKAAPDQSKYSQFKEAWDLLLQENIDDAHQTH